MVKPHLRQYIRECSYEGEQGLFVRLTLVKGLDFTSLLCGNFLVLLAELDLASDGPIPIPNIRYRRYQGLKKNIDTGEKYQLFRYG